MQVLQCLACIRDIQVAAHGGSDCLWMVAAVLRAARDHLAEENDDRQELEAEVNSLRARAMQLDTDVQAKYEELRKAEEIVADRIRRQLATKQDLEEAATQLRNEIAKVGVEIADLNWKACEGLQKQREAWADERCSLQEDIEQLGKDIETKAHRLDFEVVELARQHHEKKVTLEKQLKQLLPRAKEKTDLTKKVVLLENKINELQHTLQAIEEKEKRKRKAKGKKGRRSTVTKEEHEISTAKSPSNQDDEDSAGCNVSSCNASCIVSDEDM